MIRSRSFIFVFPTTDAGSEFWQEHFSHAYMEGKFTLAYGYDGRVWGASIYDDSYIEVLRRGVNARELEVHLIPNHRYLGKAQIENAIKDFHKSRYGQYP